MLWRWEALVPGTALLEAASGSQFVPLTVPAVSTTRNPEAGPHHSLESSSPPLSSPVSGEGLLL